MSTNIYRSDTHAICRKQTSSFPFWFRIDRLLMTRASKPCFKQSKF